MTGQQTGGGARDSFGWVGQTIEGRYRIDSVVGEGGFGVVYRGFHLGLGIAVAIKCLKIPAHFTSDAKQVLIQRFREEGVTLSKLAEHPNIVRVYDFGVTSTRDETPYLVLEWLEGQPLGALFAERKASGKGPLTEAEALGLLAPVADALAFAHKLGIAHRDIKPPNVLVVAREGQAVAKVVDFGIAKAMQDGETCTEGATHTSSGFHAFSPAHGAPEQFYAKRFGPTGPWTDVHAWGLLLCEALTLQPALNGDVPAELFLSSTGEPRGTPRKRGVHVSDAMELLCERATAIKPQDRYPSAQELVRALQSISSIQTGGATLASAGNSGSIAQNQAPQATALARPSELPSAQGISAQTAGPVVPKPPVTKPEPTRRWPLFLAGVLALTALVVGGVFAWQRTHATKKTKAKPKASASAEVANQCVALAAKPALDFERDAAAIAACTSACSSSSAAACVVRGRALIAPPTATPADRESARQAFAMACDGGQATGCDQLGELLMDHRGPHDLPTAATSFQRACDGGVQHGCRRLAILLSNGRGIKRDATRATGILQKSCEAQDQDSCAIFARYLVLGRGAPKDEARAFTLASSACNLRSALACDILGYMHERGTGAPKDLAKAAQLYDQACNGGAFEGCSDLGNSAEDGNGIPKDIPRAQSLYQKACDGGEMFGCVRLGFLAELGVGQAVDSSLAARHFRKACDGNEPAGCFSLGLMLENGRGAELDKSGAFNLYKAGCDLGHRMSCSSYGLMMAWGVGTTKDEAGGAEIQRTNCVEGESLACSRYGIALEEGRGVVKDAVAAYAYYEKACTGGTAEGCMRQGNLLLFGTGTPKDPKRAAELYQKACDAGSAESCGTLGYLYSQGQGVPRDPSKATQLWTKACNKGNKASCERLGR